MVSYSTYSEEALASFPTLDPEDVASAAIYILTCAPHVVVSKSLLEIDLLENKCLFKNLAFFIFNLFYGYNVY